MMRIAAAFVCAVALAACGATDTPAPGEPVAESGAEAPAPPAVVGQYVAVSTTAMSITGDLDLSQDVLSFAKGFRIEGGRIDAMLAPDADYSAGGGTVRDVTGNTSIMTTELRRVETVRVAADAPAPELCGPNELVSHVIVAHGAETLSVLMFSGADAPGPNAHNTQLCGVYNYQPR